MSATSVSTRPLSNVEVAHRLAAFAQTLQAKGENPYKIRAYRNAAQTIKGLRESIDQAVRAGSDVTRYPGIGKGIASALREIVFSGTLGQMEMSLASAPPELAALSEYPALDAKRVARVFKKLRINTVAALKEKLAEGAITTAFGPRMADHFRNAFRDNTEILLDDADLLAAKIHRFLLDAGAKRVEIAGDVRRRVEVVSEIVFIVETDDFPALLQRLRKLGRGIDLVETTDRDATFQVPGSIMLTIHGATSADWGTALLTATGSTAHLDELERAGKQRRRAKTEEEVYRAMGLQWVPPELREGRGEVVQAARGKLPVLVERADIRGDLHMHTVASDGLNSVEEMAEAGRERGYDYVGISDHSQSLRIARGVSVANLWAQIRQIDKLNECDLGIRILKSAEVDILADGSLDYPDDLLAELDYTICSIHSRFALGKTEQTERILRAMDHPAFNILGHATGRILLRRTGYDLDLARIARHAKDVGCYFEINADPDRLDLSVDNVREVAALGVKIAICTDAHRTGGLDYIRCGLDVARRAGLEKNAILNALPWSKLARAFKR